MRKTELHGYVYDFSVDYDAIAVDDILDIDNYLMIILLFYYLMWYNKMFGFIKKCFLQD